MKKIKGYKVTDSEGKCRDFKFEVGKTYTHNGEIEMCSSGFHFCEKVADCFNYYSFDVSNRIFEVETHATSKVIKGGDKHVTNKIRILKELSWNEMLVLANTGDRNSGNRNSGNRNSGNRNSGNRNSGSCNSGDRNSGNRNSGNRNSGSCNSGNRNSGNRNSGNRNSGDWNSGNWNSGDWNSGDWNSGDSNSEDRNSGSCNSGNRNSGNWNSGNWNSGDWNSGNWNSGDWNSGDWNSGFFNSTTPDEIVIFNKSCKRENWENSKKPRFIYDIIINRWVAWNNMSDDEKKEYSNAYVCEGYLKRFTYKEAWRNAFEKATEEDIELLKKLPNFDSEVFEEITGIDINKK